MRVKMTDVNANTMTTPFWADKALRNSLYAFTRDANEAAVALHTIAQLSHSAFGNTNSHGNIARNFFRVAGVLSSLLATRDVTTLPEAVKSHLDAHVKRCQPLLREVDEVIDKLHAHYSASERRGEKVSAQFVALGRQVEMEAAVILDQFFELALNIRHGVTTTPTPFGQTGLG